MLMEEIREEPQSEGAIEKPAGEGLPVEKPLVEGGPNIEAQPERAPEQNQERATELLTKISANTAALKPASLQELQDDAKELSSADEADRIEKLLKLADTKGVTHAVKVALALQDFYALDMMRDGLVERFHEKLESEIGSR